MDSPSIITSVRSVEDTQGLSAEMRAGYVLGRNLCLLDAWLKLVVRFSDDVPPWDWNWEYPYTLFGPSYDEWPEETFNELDTSLHILVAAQEVDAAALVELRHVLDEIARELPLVAEAAGQRAHERVVEIYWDGLASRFPWAYQFARQLLSNGSPALRSLRQMGDDLGDLMASLVKYGDHESYFTTLCCLTECARDFLPIETVQKLEKVRDLVPTPGSLFSLQYQNCVNKQLLSSLVEFDNWIISHVHEDGAFERFIILDDQRQVLTYLGVEYLFEEFRNANAMGALKILRVLIQRPGEALSTAELIETGGLSVEPAQVASYLSRYRSVLKLRKGQWRSAGKATPGHADALMGYLLPVRAGRGKSVVQVPGYRLALPPNRVAYIPVESGRMTEQLSR